LMFCGHGEGQSIPKALNDQRHALTLAGWLPSGIGVWAFKYLVLAGKGTMFASRISTTCIRMYMGHKPLIDIYQKFISIFGNIKQFRCRCKNKGNASGHTPRYHGLHFLILPWKKTSWPHGL
jgi:hypothetical protein